jgi:hypothetical protein
LGKFELLDIVGIGAFGAVYKAHDPELDRTVAIKVPRAGDLSSKEDADRFLREARSVAQLAGKFSSMEEIIPPVDSQGRYFCKPGNAFGPERPIWSYTATKPTDFFSELISGAQRLENGNTLICSGVEGRIFEVTPKGEVVWDYRNPPHVGPAVVIPGLWQPWTAPANSAVFARRYAPNFSGLAGKVLTPEKSVEEMEPNAGKQKGTN